MVCIKNLALKKKKNITRDYINFMTYSDGKNDLKDISSKLNISSKKSMEYLKILIKKKLISI